MRISAYNVQYVSYDEPFSYYYNLIAYCYIRR